MLTGERRRAYIYLVISGAVISVIFIGNIVISLRPDRDPQTGCGEEIGGKTVFLIDHTDGIPEQTRNEVIARSMKFIREEIKEGDLVSVFILTRLSESNLIPEFMRCKPKEKGNRWWENPKTVKEKFEADFLGPLRSVLEGPIPASAASPIAQALTDLSLSYQLRDAPRANLIVFSDLIEHSQALSLYHCRSKDSAIAHFRQMRAGAVERPIFTNVRIYAHIIPRLGLPKESITCRDGFWIWFFGDNAGKDSSFIPDYLPG